MAEESRYEKLTAEELKDMWTGAIVRAFAPPGHTFIDGAPKPRTRQTTESDPSDPISMLAMDKIQQIFVRKGDVLKERLAAARASEIPPALAGILNQMPAQNIGLQPGNILSAALADAYQPPATSRGIIADFYTVRGRIRALIEKHFYNPDANAAQPSPALGGPLPITDIMKDEVGIMAELDALCPTAAESYSQNSDGALLLLEAYLWSRLQDIIFDLGSTYQWCHEFGAFHFCYLREAELRVLGEYPELLPRLREYRARFATLVDRLHHDPDADRDAQVVHYVFGHGLVRLVKDPVAYAADALAIIHDAADLDVKIRRHPATWSMDSQKHFGPAFDGELMIDRRNPANADPTKRVDIIIIPALMRNGGENGLDYPGAPKTVWTWEYCTKMMVIVQEDS